MRDDLQKESMKWRDGEMMRENKKKWKYICADGHGERGWREQFIEDEKMLYYLITALSVPMHFATKTKRYD